MLSGVKTSKETVQEIANLSAEGWGVKKIARRLGVSEPTVYHYLPAETPRRAKSTPVDIRQRFDHYSQGWSVAETGREFGVTAQTIRNAFRRAGFPLRKAA